MFLLKPFLLWLLLVQLCPPPPVEAFTCNTNCSMQNHAFHMTAHGGDALPQQSLSNQHVTNASPPAMPLLLTAQRVQNLLVRLTLPRFKLLVKLKPQLKLPELSCSALTPVLKVPSLELTPELTGDAPPQHQHQLPQHVIHALLPQPSLMLTAQMVLQLPLRTLLLFRLLVQELIKRPELPCSALTLVLDPKKLPLLLVQLTGDALPQHQ